jgi:hypothetical protein
MGAEAEMTIPQADAAMRCLGWALAGVGRRTDFCSQPCGLANLQGPQTRRAFACQSQSGEANHELAAIRKARARDERQRGSKGLLVSCWPKRTGIVKGENESRGELDDDSNTGFASQARHEIAGRVQESRFFRLTASPEPEP